ncbi:ABC transporter ATP-binding protein [bacterium BFN5]|nr:ABC transporter ATP-binding protein [bacterium BFN5]
MKFYIKVWPIAFIKAEPDRVSMKIFGVPSILIKLLTLINHQLGGHRDPTPQPIPVCLMPFAKFSVKLLRQKCTVIENVGYGLRMRGISKKIRNEIAEHYIQMIGLRKFAHSYPCQLSGGMKQRVSVARAFATDPEILLMDEPFGALDEQNRIILQQELLQIWESSKKTTVFITHSIDEALCVGDKVMIMTAHPGRIKTIIDIDLPRPRDISEIRTTVHYNELFQKIWLSLREEVLKSKQLEFDKK